MDNHKKPLKCAAKDFTRTPFYIIQKKGAQQRYVASFADKEQIKSFLLAFAGKAGAGLHIKIRDLGDQDNPQDYSGKVTFTQLKNALDNFEDFIFHDGFHDFMIRHSGTGDYIVFDEHALIFIYSGDNLAPMLNSYNLASKENAQFIYNQDHWHYRPAEAQQYIADLVSYLELMPENTAGKNWWQKLLGL